MAIIVSGITLPFDQPEELALEQAKKLLGTPQVKEAFLAKKSVDARKKDNIRFVYSVGVELPGEQSLVERLNNPRVALRRLPALELSCGKAPLDHFPVVVGLGPAGLFAGLLLARQGFRPVLLEQGDPVEERTRRVERFWTTGELDNRSNVQFGEGGAGTFSDGKLTTRISDSRAGFVMEELASHGAPGEIRYQAKPHVGTDLLRHVVKAIREEIEALGGQVRFRTRLEDVLVRNGKVTGVKTDRGELPAEVVVLAPGHSARDTFGMLLERGVPMEAKPFSVGVRIEHLQKAVDQALYGKLAGHPLLPRGEYQLSHRNPDGQGVYTFCMCPGGVVVPSSSEEGGVVTNGMSRYARDENNANAALVASVDSRDFGSGPLDGMMFQRELEQAAFRQAGETYKAPAQTVGRFLETKGGLAFGQVKPSYALGVEEGDFTTLLPGRVVKMLAEGLRRFDRKQPGFAAVDAVLTGVETRTSSPLRMIRGESLEAAGFQGLYPCGEGAGYAGGIVSAAVDGVRVAQAVIGRYRAADQGKE